MTIKKQDTRRDFLKKVIVSGTGSVTFVKAASAAAEPTLPAIISLLLDDENAPLSETTFNPLASPVSQDIVIPADANFMHVDARGGGGGGSNSVFFGFEGPDLAAGADGGNGGRAVAVFDLRAGSTFESLGGSPVANVGTGGQVGISSESGAGATGGSGGQFGGGSGGFTPLENRQFTVDGGAPGSGGGGRAAITVEGVPIIVAGGGGGAGGGVGGFESVDVFAGGRGGDGGAFDDADKRAGEDGQGAEFGALGGNRRYFDAVPGSVSNSTGGIGANLIQSASGLSGEGQSGGSGGRSFDEVGALGAGSGGGGGSGFVMEFSSGAGGGGGGGESSGGGGGAAGANFVDGEVAMPGFSVDAGVGGAGGRGGLAGETGETAFSDRRGEAGAPAQIIVTFFRDNPETN